MPTYRDWLASLRSSITEIQPDEVEEFIDDEEDFVLLDVRDSDETRGGQIPTAVHLPKGFLEIKAESMVPDKDAKIVVYCAGGVRSLFAAEALQKMGYSDVSSMAGGYGRWSDMGLPVDKPFVLSDADRDRYSRHLNIPEVGVEGQAKLLQAKVLLIGAGGLGCPTALYLAAAGVGTLGILDFDVVDESNLQRQVLHNTDTIGTPKTESAKNALKKLNPAINIITHEAMLDSSNVDEIFSQYDYVVDGTDNFPTRYLINDACVKLKKPNIHGSVYRFEGQVTVFAPSLGGPCYRCLYPEPPPPELAPSCAEAGVLGVLPGIIGCLQAMETIKLIIGAGEPLVGKLLTYDGLKNRFDIKSLFKDPECDYCAPGKEFPGYIDYQFFCQS